MDFDFTFEIPKGHRNKDEVDHATGRIRLMRLPSTTMSPGPWGSAPVPSISVAPRMTSVPNGPAPSSGPRGGAGWSVSSCCATADPGVEPGSYRVIADIPSGGRFQAPQRQVQVELAAGADERVDFDVPLPQRIDHGPCCKPYGAPPARRRVV